ncbi:enoyl-CoA hydratase/isomerase family protein [Halostagnicola kamekurae]|uniref:2-(1,2-epoxy-1,2-dihydrophenyl)acetyl-CoA isomerase n=1 Tax=Halostagnicola kamekurae TaxID=619731 RepID=A0A1I6TMV5_9EURY|nr:enoyl-CoA hydratase-related protein [Halostagnicola kamekurae]SFS90515.1 2-(1,2-epoxy-1,2-dihydrophenyl)acetyl-CoA isomerase [Halostagnicola kamekurae]
MDVEDKKGVRTITFDRPESLNAFTANAATELADAIEAVDATDYEAIVLTGEGDAFSAGGDLEAMAERDETPKESVDRVTETLGRVVEAALSSELPIVARVNGDAVGAGLAITAISDFAYAVESASFSCAFVRVGLVPDTGGTFLLPELVGLRTAKRLAMTGEFISATEAQRIGLVNEAVPAEELDETVEDLLETLRKRPSTTIGLTKRAIHENMSRGWRDALTHEIHTQSLAYGSPEHEEGVRAFLADEEPDY